VLRVFQSEINAQISVIKQSRYSDFLAQQQDSKVAQQVTYWRNQVSSLQKVIDSDGAAPLNPAADPQVKLLTNQLDKWVALEQQYYKQWQCQLYGGSGCPKGNGPLAQSSHANYVHAQQEVSSLQNQIQQRDNQLASNDATQQKDRYDQAISALPAAQQQLKVAVARQNALQANFYAQNQATNGILIRLQALSQLSNHDFTVAAARFLLFLLFLLIECLPVTVKILQQPGPYEKILTDTRDHEVKEARRFLRGQSPLGPPGSAAPVESPELWPRGGRGVDALAIFSQANVQPRPARRPAEEPTRTLSAQPPGRDRASGGDETRREDTLEVGATRLDGPDHGADFAGAVHPGGDWPGDEEADEPGRDRRSPDTGELPIAHRDLRTMADDRVPASSDGSGGGLPLLWEDE
jgi:hypothetical protein